MDFSIASILTLDGVTNGAIYALLALATVLVFAVTRVIFIPQGEFVAFGALTLAILQTGNAPGTFLQRKRKARAGRSPTNGKEIKINAKTVPAFAAGQGFKDAVGDR